jgi:NADH:ubiquinone oxidoreductase subunit K
MHFIIIGVILLLSLIGALIIVMNFLNIFYLNFQGISVKSSLQPLQLGQDCAVTFEVIKYYHNLYFTIPLNLLFFYSFSLFFLSLIGISLSRQNLLKSVIYAELLLFACSLNFIYCSIIFLVAAPQIFALFIISIAAAESVIGLGLIILHFRLNQSLA